MIIIKRMSVLSEINPRFSILVFVFFLFFIPIGLAQEKELSASKSQSYILRKDAPEIKKDTQGLLERNIDFSLPSKKKELTQIQTQARLHRKDGLEFQRLGLFDEAISCFQKAIMLDPAYVEPYNDLGVVYEMKGWQDRAMDMYLRAIELNPDYLASYTNLAMVYESKGELRRAADLWKKRVKLGSPDDPWTNRARGRLEGIGLIVDEVGKELREEEVIELLKDVQHEKESTEKPLIVIPEQKLAKPGDLSERKQKAIFYLGKAQDKLKEGEVSEALNNAALALHFDPSSKEIRKFIEEIHSKTREAYDR